MSVPICYYIRNRQCIPILSAVHRQVPGAVVAYNAKLIPYCEAEIPSTPIYHQNLLTRRFLSLKPWSEALKIVIEAKSVVMGTVEYALLRHCQGEKIMAFHGTFRYITGKHAKQLLLFDTVWVNSPRQVRMLDFYPVSKKYNKKLIGYLPFLKFHDKTDSTCALIKRNLNLHPTAPTIVYLPARQRVGSWTEEVLNMAKEVPDDMQLILRPHPSQFLRLKGNKLGTLEALKKIVAAKENVHLDLGVYAYNDLLCIADVVISDATSPAEESLYYDAAQIFTRAYSSQRLFLECKRDGMPEPEIMELLNLYDCGIDLNRQSFKNWGDTIIAALNQKDDYAANRRNYFTRAFGDFSKADIIARLKNALPPEENQHD